MKKLILVILFLTAVLAAEKIALAETSAAAESKSEGLDCKLVLLKNFKRFTLKHKITTLIYRSVNYIKITARIVERGMGKCSGKYRTYMYYATKKRLINCAAGGYMVKLKNSSILQEYRFKVSDLSKVIKTSTRIKKQNLDVLEFQHRIKKARGGNVSIRVFRHYVGVDETTGAVNTEETQADTDLWMIGVVKTDEDCGDDGNVKECVAKIDLKSVLRCYTDKRYRVLVTKKNKLFCGEWAHCQLEFRDRTIRKYLHIVKVIVNADRKKKNVVGTGYFKQGKKTNRYTRFRVLSYWDTPNVEIKATARVSMIANCGDDDCVACNRHKICKVCRGGELPQGRKCVKRCSSGWYKSRKSCYRCERWCARCRNGKDCQKCAGRKVLHKGDCLSSCPSKYKPYSGVCRKMTFGARYLNANMQYQVMRRVSSGFTRWGRCFNRNSYNHYYFHAYCNGKTHTVSIFYNSHGWVFGGYADTAFSASNRGYRRGNGRAFLYSQTMNFFTTQVYYRQYTIYDTNSYGPTYGGGHDLYTRANCHAYTGSYTNLGHSYRARSYARNKRTILAGTYNGWRVNYYEVWYKY